MNYNKIENWIGGTYNFYGVDDLNFKLEETIFKVVEDQSDGWRSYYDSVEVTDSTGLIFFQEPIARVTVEEITLYTNEEMDSYVKDLNGFMLKDTEGHVWLAFGTSYYDDYYPRFVFSYNPKKQ